MNEIFEHRPNGEEELTKENIPSRPPSAGATSSTKPAVSPPAVDGSRAAVLCNSMLVARADWTLPRRWLREFPEDVRYVDAYGKGALHYAIRGNAPIDIVETIIGHGVDVNLSDNDGWTSLHLLMRLRPRDCMNLTECLLKHGVKLDLKDNSGYSALLLGVTYGIEANTLELLLKHGADPNTNNLELETPLILAAKIGCIGTHQVQVLLQHGANQLLKDASGRNALDWGREKGREALVKQMRAYRLTHQGFSS